MKKLLAFACAGMLIGNSYAQDGGEKEFRFGLEITPGISWLSPDNEKKFTNEGAALSFAWGFHAEKKLSENASFVFGLSLNYDKGNINFDEASSADPTWYLLNRDEEFIDFQNSVSNIPFGSSDTSLFWLKSRKYNFQYITIPLMIKMSTKEIGLLTYFGQFGGNLGIKVKNRVDDEVYNVTPTGTRGTQVTNEDLNLDDGAAFLRLGLHIGGGAEYNIAGNTSLYGALGFNLFFTNSVSSTDDYLRRIDYASNSNVITNISEFDQKALARSLTLSIGVLF